MEPVFDDVIQNHMDDNNLLGEAEPEPMATEPSAETNPQDKLEDEAEVSADLEMEQSADVERDESRDSVGPLLAEEPPRMDMDEIEEQEVLFETSPEKHRIELDEEESQDTESFPPIRIAPHPEPGVEDDTLDVYARAVGRKEGPKNDKYSRMLRKNQPSATNDPFSEIQDDTSGPSSGFSSKTARPPTQDDAVLPTSAANRGPRKRNVTSAKSKTRANKSLNPNGSASATSWTTIPVDPEPDFLIPGDLNVRLSGRTSGGTATTTTKTLVSLNASTLVDRDSMAKGKDDTGKAGHTIEDEADIPFPDEEPRIPTPPPPSPPIRRLRRGRSASVEVTASQATKRGKEREGSVSSVANKGETGRGKGRAKVKPSKELSAVPGIPEEPAVIEDNQVPTINPSALEPTRATGKPAKSRSMKPKKPVSSQEDKTAPAPSYPAATVKDMNELMSISTSTGLPLEEVVALFGECEGNLMITRRMANRMAGR
ncbi:hypothetical protein FRC02_008942 [Tulasnella sp. 418]|nr:hypothetical protein FRC02_008942 [Tulasnella sp. 418]